MALHTTEDCLHLSDQALESLGIAPGEMADAVEEALIAKAEGRLQVTPKSVILPGDGRYVMSTLAVGEEGYTVLKMVTVSPENPSRELPAINGAIMVKDAHTGFLKAVMGANWITAHRTAALSAVAARRLADPASSVIGFVGCGVQAHSHLRAFRDLFPLKKVVAYNRSDANRDAFLDSARQSDLEAKAGTPEEVLRESDIVVTSITFSADVEPFLDARVMKPNAFAAIADFCMPWQPEGLDHFQTFVVDDLEQERQMDKPMIRADAITGDLTDLVAGRIENPGQPAAFGFRGIALGDYAAAVLALKRAEAQNAGQQILP